MLKKIRNFIKRIYFGKKYKTKFRKGTVLSRSTFCEGSSVIGENTNIIGSYIGFGTYIAQNSKIINTKIGKYASIGENVRTCIGRHPSEKYVSTHPAFFSSTEYSGFSYSKSNKFEEHIFIDKERKYVSSIGNDTWIGNNVVILDGIKIGDGAIVGLGSVVTKDIEPYSVCAGVPARIIKYRFEKKYIDFLTDLKWWDRDPDWLKENMQKFNDIENFYSELQFMTDKGGV